MLLLTLKKTIVIIGRFRQVPSSYLYMYLASLLGAEFVGAMSLLGAEFARCRVCGCWVCGFRGCKVSIRPEPVLLSFLSS